MYKSLARHAYCALNRIQDRHDTMELRRPDARQKSPLFGLYQKRAGYDTIRDYVPQEESELARSDNIIFVYVSGTSLRIGTCQIHYRFQ